MQGRGDGDERGASDRQSVTRNAPGMNVQCTEGEFRTS